MSAFDLIMSALPPIADIGEGIAECPLMTQSGHSSRPSTNDVVRPLTAVHIGLGQGPLTDQKAAVRTTLLKPPAQIRCGHSLSCRIGALRPLIRPVRLGIIFVVAGIFCASRRRQV